MIVTHAQAMLMWCPFVRHGSDRITFNRGNQNNNPTNTDVAGATPIQAQDYGCHCIAEKCMAWRRESNTTKTYSGYCGLAGQP